MFREYVSFTRITKPTRLMLPILRNNHFVLTVFGKEKDKSRKINVHMWDSLLGPDLCMLKKEEAALVAREFFGPGYTVFIDRANSEQCQQQASNSMDCGLFTVHNSQQYFSFSHPFLPKLRDDTSWIAHHEKLDTVEARANYSETLEKLRTEQNWYQENMTTFSVIRPSSTKDPILQSNNENCVQLCDGVSSNETCSCQRSHHRQKKNSKFLHGNNVLRSANGMFIAKSGHSNLKNVSELTSDRLDISNTEDMTPNRIAKIVDQALKDVRDREQKKKLVRIKDDKIKVSHQEPWLSEREKKELIRKHSLHTPLKELIRIFRLSPDENYARVQISRVRQEIERGVPNRRTSFKQLTQRVTSILDYKAKVSKEEIHETDIQRLGIEQSICFGIDSFRGSRSWIDKIKRHCNLTSRHIDARIRPPHLSVGPSREEKVKEFRRLVVPYIKKKYPPSRIFNVDQTAVKYEMIRNRSLAERGAPRVERTAQRAHALSHSFTMNPCVSADGRLIGDTFITLSEPITPRSFQQMVAPFHNLHVTNSRSGMMTSDLAIEWFTKDFLPNVPPNSLLILDSWGGFKKMMELPIVILKKLEVIVLPPDTTSKLQPLDLSFNRQFKNFIQKFEGYIRVRENHLIISKRSTQLGIIQFAINQFKAPRFQGLIQKGFYDIGVTNKYHLYETPVSYCMDPLKTARKSCATCVRYAFIACGHCDKLMCATCSISHLH
ncbi:hypothetical protein CRE_17034 [Caenorhabditis remanei]|uniref:DDE-1 domain-containing protein n=1 Tax=Caenorhabditis remanei TaxID=31234 RepID=E3M9U3_CAERE|nr:hypothetical protein CRE_17034 [Caenorhabditis remanei]